ncbi:hypothetical protein BCR34DRAFT_590917 [Clohesyomyces aquaticus]|uniref:Uncharacterized protein n=1 Tax=Clohesyomyces aquaticus TaxID=1231657 RepID=A0A1Y1Z535_9PLEO|nr:hypothetical protein BCR34DRAFT_590917 [Clohesyomyces aquaticus]
MDSGLYSAREGQVRSDPRREEERGEEASTKNVGGAAQWHCVQWFAEDEKQVDGTALTVTISGVDTTAEEGAYQGARQARALPGQRGAAHYPKTEGTTSSYLYGSSQLKYTHAESAMEGPNGLMFVFVQREVMEAGLFTSALRPAVMVGPARCQPE